MASTRTLNPNQIAEVLDSLLGREVTAGDGQAPTPGSSYCGVASYRLEGGELVAVVVCDAEFAALSGACLALVPAETASEMAKSKNLTEAVKENAGEIFNVLAVSLARPDGPPVRLAETTFGEDALPDEAAKLVEGAGSRLEMSVDIDGYGAGLVAVYTA